MQNSKDGTCSERQTVREVPCLSSSIPLDYWKPSFSCRLLPGPSENGRRTSSSGLRPEVDEGLMFGRYREKMV